jgi:hypothetical protein
MFQWQGTLSWILYNETSCGGEEMKNNDELTNSGLLLGSEPLEDVRHWNASAQSDDDKSDSRDTDGTDGGGDSDSTGGKDGILNDGKDTDGSDSHGTDNKD